MSTTFTNSPNLWLASLPTPPACRMPEEEYLAWALQQEFRTEWVDGEVVYMSPASAEHSDLEYWLAGILRGFVHQRRLGRVLGNMMIRLNNQSRIRVPDLFFVHHSRLDIIRTSFLSQAPDLAMEIVSPDSSARDWRQKYHEYETAGISEYWIVDPNTQSFEVHHLDSSGKYQPIPVSDGVIHSTALPGFWLRSEWFAPEHRPAEQEVLRLLGIT